MADQLLEIGSPRAWVGAFSLQPQSSEVQAIIGAYVLGEINSDQAEMRMVRLERRDSR